MRNSKNHNNVQDSSPKVSVIIPVYNVERYLRQCLNSIVSQTLREIEVICVDDGSTDGSLDILQEYKERDNRIIVLQQEHKNAGEARNAGLKIAKGEYLSFLDADDFFEPQMLEDAYKYAQSRGSEIVVFRVKQYIETEDSYRKVTWNIKDKNIPSKGVFRIVDIKQERFTSILGYTWDKLFKKTMVERNNLAFQSIDVFNDSLFTYSALLCADSICILDKYLLYQRKRAAKDSITDRRYLYSQCGLDLLLALREYLRNKDLYESYERDFLQYAVHIISIFTSKSSSMNGALLPIRDWLLEFGILDKSGDYFYNCTEFERVLSNMIDNENRSYNRNHNPIKDNRRHIPVVYASDQGYMRYTLVSIKSLLENASPGTFYDIILLLPPNAPTSVEEIEARFGKYDNYRITCFNMGSEFDDVETCIEHITVPTYYRLILPDLLKSYDKCIYLDGDTVVCDDLQQLYDINLDGSYVAGVPAYIYYRDADYHRKRTGIGINEDFVYINAGVLVMNLQMMREHAMGEIFKSMIHVKYDSQDQDIINIACRGHIKTIEFRYNVMTRYAKWELCNYPSFVKPIEIVEGKARPVIVHYADKVKPWGSIVSPYANIWYAQALSTQCWDMFLDVQEKIKQYYNQAVEYMKTEKKLSYRVASVVSWIPSKVWGGIKCYRDHGFKYTLKRVLYHLQIPGERNSES